MYVYTITVNQFTLWYRIVGNFCEDFNLHFLRAVPPPTCEHFFLHLWLEEIFASFTCSSYVSLFATVVQAYRCTATTKGPFVRNHQPIRYVNEEVLKVGTSSTPSRGAYVKVASE